MQHELCSAFIIKIHYIYNVLINFLWMRKASRTFAQEWMTQLISHYSCNKLSRWLCTWFCHAQLKLWLTFAREDAQSRDQERDITECHVSLIRDLMRREWVRRIAEVSCRSEGRCLLWAPEVRRDERAGSSGLRPVCHTVCYWPWTAVFS